MDKLKRKELFDKWVKTQEEEKKKDVERYGQDDYDFLMLNDDREWDRMGIEEKLDNLFSYLIKKIKNRR